jgi:formylglycine-generating enzyme required for sulfatase activity
MGTSRMGCVRGRASRKGGATGCRRRRIADRPDRVLRGGAFATPSAFLRSANRGRLAPAARFPFNGFRPARTIR